VCPLECANTTVRSIVLSEREIGTKAKAPRKKKIFPSFGVSGFSVSVRQKTHHVGKLKENEVGFTFRTKFLGIQTKAQGQQHSQRTKAQAAGQWVGFVADPATKDKAENIMYHLLFSLVSVLLGKQPLLFVSVSLKPWFGGCASTISDGQTENSL